MTGRTISGNSVNRRMSRSTWPCGIVFAGHPSGTSHAPHAANYTRMLKLVVSISENYSRNLACLKSDSRGLDPVDDRGMDFARFIVSAMFVVGCPCHVTYATLRPSKDFC